VQEGVRVGNHFLVLERGGHGPRSFARLDGDLDFAAARTGVVAGFVSAQQRFEELRTDSNCCDKDNKGQHQDQQAPPAPDLLGRTWHYGHRRAAAEQAGVVVVRIRRVGLELVGPKLVALMEVLVIGVRENDVQVIVMLIVQMLIVQVVGVQMLSVLVVGVQVVEAVHV
jgi:hypothetical protein